MALDSTRAGHSSGEPITFEPFFEPWLTEQEALLRDLAAAASAGTAPQPLLAQVVQHYELYYCVKARWARRDVLAMLTPKWRSSLEEAFLWIGGWRPSTAFHLFYSKSGLQLLPEGRIIDLIDGLTTGDLSEISPEQLNAVDEMQARTISAEREISEEMARQQETLAGADLVELSHAATTGAPVEAGVDEAVAARERGLEEVLERADRLRLQTLKGVLAVLTPEQAVHFLIAAAELHLRIHEWGRRKDAGRRNGGVGPSYGCEAGRCSSG